MTRVIRFVFAASHVPQLSPCSFLEPWQLPGQDPGFSGAVASPAAFRSHRKNGAVAARCCWAAGRRALSGAVQQLGLWQAHPRSLLELPGLSTWLEAGFSPRLRYV